MVAKSALILYAVLAVLYSCKEFVLARTTGFFNVPKNLVLAGTALSWWAGIVALNSDMAFTMTNVLSHGIPYMALIWLYQHKAQRNTEPRCNSKSTIVSNFGLSCIPAFLAVLFLLAYLEEGLWDGLIWREHLSIFALFANLPVVHDPAILALLVPILSLPQSTHYVLDGFIWRIKDRSSIWST